MNIIKGPAAEWSREDEVKIEDCPFAYQLEWFLRRREASVILLEETIKIGERIGANGFTQLHITRNEPEALAAEIVACFGKALVFGTLGVPVRGCQCVTVSRAGNVWVRHIVDCVSDQRVQRWDVLIKAGKV